VDLWKGAHPPKLVQTLVPDMKLTFWVAVLGFHLAYGALLWARLRYGRLRDETERLQLELEAKWDEQADERVAPSPAGATS
jgi:hypothetical protein